LGKKKSVDVWANRIVGYGEEDPEQVLANPWNWRIHPKDQQRLVSGVLDDIGFVVPILINKRNDRLIDGHLRVVLALRHGQKKIPAAYVDLSEEEERAILLILDKSSSMAGIDEDIYQENMAYIEGEFQAIQGFVESELKRLGGSLGSDPDPREEEGAYGCILVVCQDRKAWGVLVKRWAIKKKKPDLGFMEELMMKLSRVVAAGRVIKELGRSKKK